MKTIIAILAATFTIGNAQAARVVAVSADMAKQIVNIDVVYAGGCKEHEFKLVNKVGCQETYPVSCVLELEENTNGDMCEAMVHRKIQFTFEELGFVNSYYSRAGITIKGDNGTRAGFRLPEMY